MNKTNTEQRDYEEWKARFDTGNIKDSKEQYKSVSRVREKLSLAKTGRSSLCYWLDSTDDGEGASGWDRVWSDQLKVFLQWYQPSGADNFKSNVKSPMSTGRIESTFQKFRKLNYGWDVLPATEEDRGKEKICKVLLNHWFEKADAKEAIATWVKDALIHGSAIARVTYAVQKGKYRFPMSQAVSLKDKSKEERKKIEEQIKSGKIVYREPEEVIKYEDILVEAKAIESVYFDSAARNIHGKSFAARYAIEERFVSLDDFYQEFSSDPNATNVKKVKGQGTYSTDSAFMFFDKPETSVGADMVQILEYENIVDDEYIVIANGILIKRTPLPYNHKELTYHKIDCIKLPHQFYNIGISDFLKNVQGTQEMIINMAIDYVLRTMRQKTLVDAYSYPEIGRYEREESQYIPVDLTDGKPISAKAMQLPNQPLNFDFFRVNEIMNEFATLATQIDPAQMALFQGSSTATMGMINKEQTEVMLSSLATNFAEGGFITMGRQIWSIMQQKYTVPKVKQVVGDGNKSDVKNTYKKIRLDGLEIVVDKNGYNVEEKEKDYYSFFELKDEYLNTSEQLDIRIMPDSLESLSKGLKMQKSKESYAQLMPNAVDPEDQEAINLMKKQGIVPLYDARKLAEYMFDENAIPREILLDKEVLDEQEVKEALDETEQMLAGAVVAGKPGRSSAHYRIHAQIFNDLMANIENLEQEIIKSMEGMEPVMDELGQMMPPEPDLVSVDKIKRMVGAKESLVKHIMTDTIPLDLMDESVVSAASPPPPPPPMPGNTPVPDGSIPMPQNTSMQDVMPGMAGPEQAAAMM